MDILNRSKQHNSRAFLLSSGAALITSVLWGVILHFCLPSTPAASILFLGVFIYFPACFTVYALLYLYYTQHRKRNLIIFLTIYLSMTVSFFAAFLNPDYVYDNWQIYDISRYIFTNPGYGNQIRQHIIPTHYEMSFPPVMPLLVYLVNCIIPLKVLACPFIVYIFSILSLYEAIVIYERSDKNRDLLLLTFLIFFCHNLYLSQIRSGNSTVIGVYLFLKLYNILSGPYSLRKKYFSGILVVSFGLMNRFDFLSVFILFLVLFPVIFCLKERHSTAFKKFLYVLSMTVLALIAVFPWIAYSFFHFGVPFITDNGRRIFNIEDTRPSTFFPQSLPAETIFDNFTGWLRAFLKRALSSVKSGVHCLIYCTIIPPFLLCFFKDLCQTTVKSVYRVKDLRFRSFCTEKVLFYLCVLSQEVLVLFTGYPDQRYHLTFILFLTIALLKIFDFSLDKEWYQTSKKICAFYTAVFCLSSMLFCLSNLRNASKDRLASYLTLSENQITADQYLSENDAMLVVSRINDLDFPKYSALCHHSTIYAPSNLSAQNAVDFVDVFGVNYLYTSDQNTFDIFSNSFTLNPISEDLPNFYKLIKK